MLKLAKKKIKNILLSFYLGKFLAQKQLRSGNKGVSILIVIILFLTFISLVVIPGILTGLIEGSTEQRKNYLTGDIYFSPLAGEQKVLNTEKILAVLQHSPERASLSTRKKTTLKIQSGYIKRDNFTKDPDSINISAFIIDPLKEKENTHLDHFIVEGDFLSEKESQNILIGSNLLKKYSKFSDLFEPLRYVKIGDPVLVSFLGKGGASSGIRPGPSQSIGGAQKSDKKDNYSEFFVKGIVKSKVSDLSSAVYISQKDYTRITGDRDPDVNEIVLKLKNGVNPEQFKKILIEKYHFNKYAKIQTAEEAIPKFLLDVQKTFAVLGNILGFVGLVVSSITVFIVIYINALTRRKFIGILKGIGISELAIEISYLLQSLFYAFLGIGLGILFLYSFLIPLIAKHPIDFPMSDGILLAPWKNTIIRASLLLIVTILAGFIPARMIVKKNTLDSILQR